MAKRILIMKDLNYGTKVTTANDALSPELLADGAVGVYGVVGGQSSNNANKTALIVDHATTDTAGNYADELFRANKDANPTFVVVQGATEGGLTSAEIPINGIISIKAVEYAAPVNQVSHIGYDADGTGGLGLLNTPTITANQEALVKVIQTNFQAGGEPHNRQNFGPDVSLIAAETDYNLMVKMVGGLAKMTEISLNGYIKSATAGAAGAAGEDLSAVNGATTMTIAADPSWDVGDFIRIVGSNGIGDTYKCVTGTTTTTVVVDRPYTGVTEVIDNLDLFDLGTVTGEVGLALEAQTVNEVYKFAVDGALSSATITYTTGSSRGSGSGEHVARLEEDRQVTKGEYDQITTYYPHPRVHVNTATNYDLYFINYHTQSLTDNNPFITTNELIVAFPDAPSNGGQQDFEDIMGFLVNGAPGLGGIAAA